MERSVDISTGESVAFSYELAGLGSRFIAVALDFTIQMLVALAVVLFFAWIAYRLPNAPPVKLSAATKVATRISVTRSR